MLPGRAQVEEGIAAYRATGAGLDHPHCLVLLGRGYQEIGQAEAGLAVLAEVLTVIDASGERYYEAEAYRVKGKLLLHRPTPDRSQAEAGFQQALAIARRQQAKSWALRAALSLSRLWQQRGEHAEARALLAPLYGWFTEGVDTADLQEAQALLDELS